MSDFIHKREFVVYSPLVKPMPMYAYRFKTQLFLHI